MLEKVPDIWAIASCFQQLNCLNQRGECPVEPKDEIRTEAHKEESLTESEDGSGCESKREDEPIQWPDFDLALRTKWEPEDKWLLVTPLVFLAGVFTGVFTAYFGFLYEQFQDLSRGKDVAEMLAVSRKCVMVLILLKLTVYAIVLIMCYYKKQSKEENRAESQEDDDDQQPDHEASPKSSWTRAKKIAKNITYEILVSIYILYSFHLYATTLGCTKRKFTCGEHCLQHLYSYAADRA